MTARKETVRFRIVDEPPVLVLPDPAGFSPGDLIETEEPYGGHTRFRCVRTGDFRESWNTWEPQS